MIDKLVAYVYHYGIQLLGGFQCIFYHSHSGSGVTVTPKIAERGGCGNAEIE